jgi:hypothetical protein
MVVVQSSGCSAKKLLVALTRIRTLLCKLTDLGKRNPEVLQNDLSFMPLMTSCFEDSSLLECHAVSAGKYLPTFRTRAMLPHSNKNTAERISCLTPRLKELQIFKTTAIVYISRHDLVSEKLRVFSGYSIITANLVFWANILLPRN